MRAKGKGMIERKFIQKKGAEWKKSDHRRGRRSHPFNKIGIPLHRSKLKFSDFCAILKNLAEISRFSQI